MDLFATIMIAALILECSLSNLKVEKAVFLALSGFRDKDEVGHFL